MKEFTNRSRHFFDSPVEDLDSADQGFERGLRTAVTEICKLMEDPSYFGRGKVRALKGQE